jgi:hypothetical protein
MTDTTDDDRPDLPSNAIQERSMTNTSHSTNPSRRKALTMALAAAGAMAAAAVYVERHRQMVTHGLWEYKWVGSMAAGSNVLVLAKPSEFVVGDQVIIEVGGEAGKGQYGTMGVGGIYPARPGYEWHYYLKDDAPKALVAKITAIEDGGRRLILDKSAATTTNDADVYFDNFPILESLFRDAHPPGWLIEFPAGKFATSGQITVGDARGTGRVGWIVKGAGKNVTTFRTPKGAPGSGFWFYQADNTTVSDFSIIGNFGRHGFGFQEMPNGGWFDNTKGIQFGGVRDCVARNMSVTDVWHFGFAADQSCDGVLFEDCEIHLTEPVMTYAAWRFIAADSRNVTFLRCRHETPWLQGGFETFRSNHTKFIDCTGVNATWSSNSSGNWLLENFTLTVKPRSQFSTGSFSELNPMVNVNSNVQPPDPEILMGGMVKNIDLDCQGYINSDPDKWRNLKGIVVNDQNPKITIDGGTIRYRDPGFASGVVSTGPNTVVRNLTVIGSITSAHYPGANIYVPADGVVENCAAEVIRVG